MVTYQKLAAEQKQENREIEKAIEYGKLSSNHEDNNYAGNYFLYGFHKETGEAFFKNKQGNIL